jgi:hypothetical protein
VCDPCNTDKGSHSLQSWLYRLGSAADSWAPLVAASPIRYRAGRRTAAPPHRDVERNKAHRADNPPVQPIHLIAAGLKMHCPGGALSQTGSEAQSPGHVAMPMPRGGAGPPRGRSGTPNRAVRRRGIIAICATYGHARPVEAGRNRTPVGLMFAAEVNSETADKKTARRRSLGRF